MKLVIEIKGQDTNVNEPMVHIELEVENLVKLLNYVEALREKAITTIDIPKIKGS